MIKVTRIFAARERSNPSSQFRQTMISTATIIVLRKSTLTAAEQCKRESILQFNGHSLWQYTNKQK